MTPHVGMKAGLALIGLLALPGLLLAQGTPTISGIQSGFGTATNGAAITAATPTPDGCFESSLCLNLFINGNFNPASNQESVTWTENSVQTTLFLQGTSTTQLIANVPANLYQSAGIATITVTETLFDCEGSCSTSTTSTFTVNPAMASVGTLPAGIVGVAYSQPFFTGGTGNSISGANFTVQFGGRSPPPCLAATPNTGNPLCLRVRPPRREGSR